MSQAGRSTGLMLTSFAFALLLFTGYGCSIKVGSRFDSSHIPDIKTGVTTRAKILELMGERARQRAELSNDPPSSRTGLLPRA